MNLDKLVVIGGVSGIHKVAANRSNGLIVENFDTGKKRFVGSRKYQFTPLGSVTIYAENPDDVIKLSDVFEGMLAQKDSLPVIAANSSKEELHKYFGVVMPTYDKDRVHASDMKKIIKWFNFLNERDLFPQLELEAQEAEAAAAQEAEAELAAALESDATAAKTTETTE